MMNRYPNLEIEDLSMAGSEFLLIIKTDFEGDYE